MPRTPRTRSTQASAGPPGRSGAGRERGEESSLPLGLARAFGGAIFFSLPLLMTMEMWWLGFYMDRVRLALLLGLMVPLLIVLDHYSGFRETSTWTEDVLDGLTAYGVGFVAAAAVLLLLDVIGFSTPLREVVGKISLQAVPAAIGAVFANSQLARGPVGSERRRRQENAGYGAEVFFMAAGAIFFSITLAPTEEMVLIAYDMTSLQGALLALLSLALMHAFVYGVNFRGQPAPAAGVSGWSIFARFSVVGYAVALLISAYVLWTFGRFEPMALDSSLMQAVVLGFPASLGAAAARLIL